MGLTIADEGAMMVAMSHQSFDLEERTAHFAQSVQLFLRTVPRNAANAEYGKQLIRSSGSVAANYIEANESLGEKDFFMHVKIAKKEAKESRLWLRLLELRGDAMQEKTCCLLIQEAHELTLIFVSIAAKQGTRPKNQEPRSKNQIPNKG